MKCHLRIDGTAWLMLVVETHLKQTNKSQLKPQNVERNHQVIRITSTLCKRNVY